MVVLQAGAEEILPDPTRPALDLNGGGGAAVVTEPQRNEGLQSVYISPRQRLAIINGKQFELGDKVGNARLVEINEHGVVLQGSEGRRVMEVFPAIKKQPSRVVAKKDKAVPDKTPEQDTGVQSALPEDGGESK